MKLSFKGVKMGVDILSKGVACKDEKSFELLYDKMYKLVYLVCLGVVKNEASAQDLAQDTFITVWNKSSEFKGGSYKAWILTIAKNKSLNYIKKNSRVIPVGQDYELDAMYSCEPSSLEDSIILKLVLHELDEMDAQIVLLKLSGMKMKEIAELFEIPRGTASWRYSEALKKLKKILTKGEGR